jgi:hypothetical protein
VAEFRKNPQQEIERVLSLHQGSNSRNVPWLINDSQAVFVENMIINQLGIRERRRGARSFGGRNEAPGGIGSYNDTTFDEFIVAMWGGLPYNSTGNAAWTRIGTNVSLSSTDLMDFQRVFQGGNLAIAIGNAQQTTEASTTLIYDIQADESTNVSLGTEIPRAHASFQNRLWIGAGQTLYWSNIVEPAHMSEGNTLTIEPGLGGEITALIPSRDLTPRMWVFKHDAVLLLEPRWGASSALIPSAGDALDVVASSLKVLTQGAGCIATRSAVWVPGQEGADLFFLSADGVRSLNRAENDVQAGAGFPVSYDIPSIVNRINFTHAHKASAAVFDNAYHLAVPLDGAVDNTHVMRYDIRDGSWSLHDWQSRDLRVFSLGSDARFFFQSNIRSGDSSVTDVVADATLPHQVFQGFNGGLDPSESHIDFTETSKAFIFQEPFTEKTWDELTLNLSSSDTASIRIQYRLDFGPWTDLEDDIIPGSTGTIVLGQDSLPWVFSEDTIRKRSYFLKDIAPGKALQIRLTSQTAATDVGRVFVYGQEVKATVRQPEFLKEN